MLLTHNKMDCENDIRKPQNNSCQWKKYIFMRWIWPRSDLMSPQSSLYEDIILSLLLFKFCINVPSH